MLTVGITGGIGSGKTTVCRVFGVLGVPVFHADVIARQLQDEDPGIRASLSALFGTGIYDRNGLLNRKKLAGIIFTDSALLKRVNGIVHPVVHRTFDNWKKLHAGCPYVLYEAAILFETGSYHTFDYTILVTADVQERLDRVMKRDQATAEAIIQRMKNQMDDTEKKRLADFVLENNDNQLIIPEILKLDQILKVKNHVW